MDYNKPSGYDRARNREVGKKDITLETMEEAFTSEHWIVRIFKASLRYTCSVVVVAVVCVCGVTRAGVGSLPSFLPTSGAVRIKFPCRKDSFMVRFFLWSRHFRCYSGPTVTAL